MAIICPIAHYCPGVGNTVPISCYPGTYASSLGQSVCTICPIGSACPDFTASRPKLCAAGFVCDSRGLSSPEKLCPPGFNCEKGTATEDPDEIFLVAPIKCPKGTFCLGGVAHNKSIQWLPNQQEGKHSPQSCNEGFFCPSGSFFPTTCYPGHYCPNGSPFPLQVPVGTFSGKGAIAPTICFPGTYSPAKGSNECISCPAGYSCKGHGTFVPKICPKGTYRSKADSVSCKIKSCSRKLIALIIRFMTCCCF